MSSKCQPEYTSVEAFVEYIRDDERPYTIAEVEELAFWTRKTPLALNRILKAAGLVPQGQGHEQRVRTVNDNPNDRWQACPSHGGGGGSSLEGFAGRAG